MSATVITFINIQEPCKQTSLNFTFQSFMEKLSKRFSFVLIRQLLMTTLHKFLPVFLCMWSYLSILGTCTFTLYTVHLPSHQCAVHMCEAYHSCSAVARIWKNSNLFGSPDLERRKYTLGAGTDISAGKEKAYHLCCLTLYQSIFFVYISF
jgi:hypothetical protein